MSAEQAEHPPAEMVVGVATYERGEAIKGTLETIAALGTMGGRVRRAVIVDNGSRDEGAVIRRFIEQSRDCGGLTMEMVRETTPGKSAALRRLFAETHEAYVAVTDDDCLLDAGWAEAMTRRLDAAERCGAVGGRMAPGWESGPTRLALKYARTLGAQDLGDKALLLADRGAFLGGACMAYRRAAVQDSGWLDAGMLDCRRGEAVEHGEDAELCLRIRRAGWEVWYEPEASLTHLVPADRQTGRSLASMRESIRRSEPILRWVASEGGLQRGEVEAELARAERLHWKTLLTDWRPTRRAIRLGERRGWRDGWRRVRALMADASAAAPQD